MPSPMTQTPRAQANETASAGRTVLLKSRPTPMASWISAKNVFHTATSGATKLPMCVMKSPSDEGLAAGVGQDARVDEAPAEHEGLELQGGVEDPEQAEDDLQRALGADGEGEARRAAVPRRASVLRAPVAVHALVTLPAACRMARSGPIGGRAVGSPGRCSRVGVTASATGCR